VISACRAQVRSFLQVVFAKISVVILTLTRKLSHPLTRNLDTKVDVSCRCVLNNPKNDLWILQIDILIRKRKLLEHLYNVELLFHRNMATYTVNYEFVFLIQFYYCL
jgi:hypothetical protein